MLSKALEVRLLTLPSRLSIAQEYDYMLGRGLNRDRQTRIVSAEEHMPSSMTVSKLHWVGACRMPWSGSFRAFTWSAFSLSFAER